MTTDRKLTWKERSIIVEGLLRVSRNASKFADHFSGLDEETRQGYAEDAKIAKALWEELSHMVEVTVGGYPQP